MFVVGALGTAVYELINNPTEKTINLVKDILILIADPAFIPMNKSGIVTIIKQMRESTKVEWFLEPDEVYGLTLLDENAPLECDSRSEVKVYNGKICVRWTLPSTDYIVNATNVNKLILLTLVAIEELVHIIQIWDPENIRIFSFPYEEISISAGMFSDEFVIKLLENDIVNIINKFVDINEPIIHEWLEFRSNSYEKKYKLIDQEVFISICRLIKSQMKKYLN
jgi:hypothetical protein